MKVYKWAEVETERLSEISTRQVILGDNIMLTMNRSKAGRRVPGHTHEELMQYVLQGALKYKSGDEEKIVRAGEVIRVPAGVWHEIEILEDMVVVDVFSPPKSDYVKKAEGYLKGA
jgi:quercetin dioxygenase-like cupin family protein